MIDTNKKKRYKFIFVMLCIQAVLGLMCFECLVRGSLVAVCSWVIHHPIYMLYNFAMVFLLLWLFYVLCNDLRWGYILVQLVLLIFGAAESIKLANRKEYIEFSDLMIAGEWGEAASDVQFHDWGTVVCAALFLLCIIAFLWKKKAYWKWRRTRKGILISFGAVFAAMLVFVGAVYVPAVYTGYKGRVALGMQGEEKGSLVCFMESIAYYNMTSVYSDDIYAEAIDFAETSGATQSVEDIQIKPNVIVIMSEALWDINQLSDVITFNKNPMEDFDRLGESAVCGKTASNVFGGGTDKSEFEFLTGWNSKYAVNGSSPYRDFFTHGQASIVQYFKELGYTSYGIHPYKGTFWGRDTAYANMGFDAFYDMNSMHYQDKYDIYISDASLTNEIIYRYEEQKKQSDAPIFSFNVSMANHVTKIMKGEAAPVCKEIYVDYKMDYTRISAYNRKKLKEYVNGVYVSGQALSELIDYFSEVEEPTVIVVFGDHAPSFLSDFEPYVSEELATEAFYETPFYVWNNYGLGEFGEDEVNISYLSELLLEYIGFPLPKQAMLNKYLRSYCPVDTRYIVKDAMGNVGVTRKKDYVNRSYGASNAMHYVLNMDSYAGTDIWKPIE